MRGDQTPRRGHTAMGTVKTQAKPRMGDPIDHHRLSRRLDALPLLRCASPLAASALHHRLPPAVRGKELSRKAASAVVRAPEAPPPWKYGRGVPLGNGNWKPSPRADSAA